MFDDFLNAMSGIFGSSDSGQTSAPAPQPAPSSASSGSFMPTNQDQPWWLPILIGGGATLAGKLLNSGTDSQIEKLTKQLTQGSKTANKAGKQLVGRAAAGQLTDPQQASVDRMKAEQNAKWNQYLSNLGIPVSSTQVQAANLVDTQATELANKLINESMSQGLDALKVGTAGGQAMLQTAMQQRADMTRTIWEVAQEIGRVLGTKPQTPAPAPVASPYVPSEWGGSSVYDISSPEGMGY